MTRMIAILMLVMCYGMAASTSACTIWPIFSASASISAGFAGRTDKISAQTLSNTTYSRKHNSTLIGLI